METDYRTGQSRGAGHRAACAGRVGRIGRLRERLLEARRHHSLEELRRVEEGLLRLAGAGYRCCLLDYERLQPLYYIRLLDYENGRLKAELEFPIAPGVDKVQWLPLSHLADYEEVVDRAYIGRIYQGLAPYIHQRQIPLRLAPRRRPLLPPPAPRVRNRHRVWWYVGSGFAILCLGLLIAMQVSNGYH